MKKKRQKVVVAVSGGVDSSVVARLLMNQGYEALGVFMRLFDHGVESERAARLVCKKIGINFYPVNLSEKFSNEVKDYFLKSYEKGVTPNPCVRCNKLIKFGELLRLKNDFGADFLATGHYIRSEKLEVKSENKNNSTFFYKLFRGCDENKDQSYFLYNLTQEQLKEILFPLGDMTKEEVKKIADDAGIPHLRKESQDICFLSENGRIINHNEYLKNKIKLIPGDIKTADGIILGQHQGLPLYTIGQRRGVEIGGIGPFYVSGLDYKTNTLYVVNDEKDPQLYSDEFSVKEVNWISGFEPKMPFECDVVIRYRHKSAICKITKTENNAYLVKLKSRERAVCSGQSAVFYLETQVLGGGIIC